MSSNVVLSLWLLGPTMEINGEERMSHQSLNIVQDGGREFKWALFVLTQSPSFFQHDPATKTFIQKYMPILNMNR